MQNCTHSHKPHKFMQHFIDLYVIKHMREQFCEILRKNVKFSTKFHSRLLFQPRCLLEFRQNSSPDYYSTPDCYSDDKSNINQAKINITYKHILDAMNIYKLRYSYNSLFSKLMKILNIYIF